MSGVTAVRGGFYSSTKKEWCVSSQEYGRHKFFITLGNQPRMRHSRPDVANGMHRVRVLIQGNFYASQVDINNPAAVARVSACRVKCKRQTDHVRLDLAKSILATSMLS